MKSVFKLPDFVVILVCGKFKSWEHYYRSNFENILKSFISFHSKLIKVPISARLYRKLNHFFLYLQNCRNNLIATHSTSLYGDRNFVGRWAEPWLSHWARKVSWAVELSMSWNECWDPAFDSNSHFLYLFSQRCILYKYRLNPLGLTH